MEAATSYMQSRSIQTVHLEETLVLVANVLLYTDPPASSIQKSSARVIRLPRITAWNFLAPLLHLEAPKRPCQGRAYSDSKYVVDAANQKWVSMD